MAADRTAGFAIPAAAALLLWPAVWNRYPIVFADTGTYLSQAIHRSPGWDRPVFYSLFMLPLHLTITVWPVVAVQALLAAWVLWLVCRVLLARVSRIGFVAGVAVLTLCTWWPWLVSELMPDLFTPLLVLAIGLLVWTPDRLSPAERWCLVFLAAFMIATQQSSLLLAGLLLGMLAAIARSRWIQTSGQRTGRSSPWLLIAPPALALLALCTLNLAAFGRFTPSPFGNIFLLARVIGDGPGLDALRRDCPTAHWRLCPFLSRFPATSDDFLWTLESPLNKAGGPKLVSLDANAIIRAALVAAPAAEARAALANTLEQLGRFASGDGLNPWPKQVSPWIERDFPPREAAAYQAARQQAGSLVIPPILGNIHLVVALTGVAACILLLPVALTRRAPCAGFLLAVLLALPFNAAITGALSAPHDRYQSRIMVLPAFVAAVALASLRQRAA